ncbi:hypothetical protein Q3G72_025871 [Acer saccharum]|nr:hypothetical protein Q3G72_025871 [Acer saccharum]
MTATTTTEQREMPAAPEMPQRRTATEDTTLQTKLLRRCRKQLEILKAAPNAVTSVENMLVQSIVCQEIRN